MRVRKADFADDYAVLRAIRFAVFVDEQSVPEEIELDERDPVCVHVLALGDDETPLGTARIDLEQGGKVGRLAVLAPHRRAGVGIALMQALHAIAGEQALERVWCNAQTSAVRFYEQLGYEIESAPFFEAGIEHVRMAKRL